MLVMQEELAPLASMNVCGGAGLGRRPREARECKATLEYAGLNILQHYLDSRFLSLRHLPPRHYYTFFQIVSCSIVIESLHSDLRNGFGEDLHALVCRS